MLTATEDALWRWELLPDPRPVQELALWAGVLSGRRVVNATSIVPMSLAELRDNWRKLTAARASRSPSDLRRGPQSLPGQGGTVEEREFADGLPFRYRQPSILAAKRTGCLDLSPYANANRTSAATELSGLPVGRHTWAGIEFELSDVIMLAGARLTQLGLDFPEQVTGIRVGRNCRLIHFLHSGYRDREAHMASYVIHFANGLTWEIPVTGEHVSTWRVDRYAEQRPNEAKRCVTAWQGEDKPGLVQLSVASWGNPLPDLPVESIALVSGGSWGSVFVAAITVE